MPVLFGVMRNWVSFAEDSSPTVGLYLWVHSFAVFQILKDDAMKVLHSICQQIGKLSGGHKTGKGQFSFQSQRKAMPKNVQTTTYYTHLTC